MEQYTYLCLGKHVPHFDGPYSRAATEIQDSAWFLYGCKMQLVIERESIELMRYVESFFLLLVIRQQIFLSPSVQSNEHQKRIAHSLDDRHGNVVRSHICELSLGKTWCLFVGTVLVV